MKNNFALYFKTEQKGIKYITKQNGLKVQPQIACAKSSWLNWICRI